MRMSELSERSGVPVATIKYYLRENLLPAGERTSPNQASYGEPHVERLRLVKALLDVGGLSVVAASEVIGAIDDTDMPLTWAFGVAQRAISEPPAIADVTASRGTEMVESVMAELGWQADEANPGRAVAARVLDSYAQLGHDNILGVLPHYARAAAIVAQADLEAVGQAPERANMVQTVIVGTVLGDALFAGLRRIAQENVSRHLFPAPPTADPNC